MKKMSLKINGIDRGVISWKVEPSKDYDFKNMLIEKTIKCLGISKKELELSECLAWSRHTGWHCGGNVTIQFKSAETINVELIWA